MAAGADSEVTDVLPWIDMNPYAALVVNVARQMWAVRRGSPEPDSMNRLGTRVATAAFRAGYHLSRRPSATAGGGPRPAPAASAPTPPPSLPADDLDSQIISVVIGFALGVAVEKNRSGPS